MAGMLNELRMLLADRMLGWAVLLAPKGHPDGQLLVRAVEAYLRACIAARRKS